LAVVEYNSSSNQKVYQWDFDFFSAEAVAGPASFPNIFRLLDLALAVTVLTGDFEFYGCGGYGSLYHVGSSSQPRSRATMNVLRCCAAVDFFI
jgi:hypothetical protein